MITCDLCKDTNSKQAIVSLRFFDRDDKTNTLCSTSKKLDICRSCADRMIASLPEILKVIVRREDPKQLLVNK